MTPAAKSLVGSLILASVLSFGYGCVSIYTALRDSALANTEGKTTGLAQPLLQSRDRHYHDPLRCVYTIKVDGGYYPGHGTCPDQIDTSVKPTILNPDVTLRNSTVTVYYDPADPNTNSTTEFGAKSAIEYKTATASILIGVGILLLLALGFWYLGATSGTNQGIVVDSQGTVIYPDKIDPNQQP